MLARRLPAVVTLSYWLLLMAVATVATVRARQGAQDNLKQLGLLDKALAHRHIQAARSAVRTSGWPTHYFKSALILPQLSLIMGLFWQKGESIRYAL